MSDAFDPLENCYLQIKCTNIKFVLLFFSTTLFRDNFRPDKYFDLHTSYSRDGRSNSCSISATVHCKVPVIFLFELKFEYIHKYLVKILNINFFENVSSGSGCMWTDGIQRRT
jgi:hypothetical protein